VSLTEFYAVVEVPVGGHLGMGQHPLLPYMGTYNHYSTAIFWKPITILSPYYHHIWGNNIREGFRLAPGHGASAVPGRSTQ
jgi:hypothetical protein